MRESCTHNRDDRSPVTAYVQVFPRFGDDRTPLQTHTPGGGSVLATWSIDTCCGAGP